MESFENDCELEYCYDDLSFKLDHSLTKWKNNSDYSHKPILAESKHLKENIFDDNLIMDLDSEIIEILEQDLDLFKESFLIPEVLDLTRNYFIETSTPTDDLFAFKINDLVCVGNKKAGYLRFSGRVHFAEGLFCGIELLDKDGKHDGKIDNIRYFKCKPNYGLFAPIEKVKPFSFASSCYPKIEKIRFSDQYPIDYNSKHIFKPISLNNYSHANNDPFEIKKFKSNKNSAKQIREYKFCNTMTSKVVIQKSGGNQTTIKKDQSIQNQHSSNQKSSLLNKLSQQFKLKFNSTSVAKNEAVENEKRKTLDVNELTSSIDQSKKSKLKAPLSFKQTSANKLQINEKNQSRPHIESKLSGSTKILNPTLIAKSEITTNHSKISNLNDFIKDNISLKRNDCKNPNSTGHTSSDSSSGLNMRLEDNIFSSSSNFISSTSSISSTTSPSRLKTNNQSKRLSGLPAPEVKNRTSAIPGVSKTTTIPSSSNQNKILRLSSIQNHSSNKQIESNFTVSTPKSFENKKNEQDPSSLNLMKQSTSSKNTNSIFLKRLSHPVKLGLNQNNAYAYNSQLNQYSNIPPTRSTNNELATKPPKLSLSYKRSSIQSQHVITKNQLAFSKDHVDLSKSESNSNKIQMNRTFDIEDQLDEKIQSNSSSINGLTNIVDEKIQSIPRSVNSWTKIVDEKQKRHGILLFDSTNNLNDGFNDDFLENELIPDDLMDDIHLNNVTGPSPNNKNWLNASFLNNNTNMFCKKIKLDTGSKLNLTKTKSASSINLTDPKPESSFNSPNDNYLVQSKQTHNQIQNEVKSVVENLLQNVCQANELTINLNNDQDLNLNSAESMKYQKEITNEPIKQKDKVEIDFENEMEVVLVEIKKQESNLRDNYLSNNLKNDENLMITERDIFVELQETSEILNEENRSNTNSMNKTFDKSEFSSSPFNIQVNSTFNNCGNRSEVFSMNQSINSTSDIGKKMTKIAGINTPAANRTHSSITLAKNSIQKKLDTKFTNNTTKTHESLNQIKDLAKKNAESSLTNQSNSNHKSQFIKKTTSSANQKVVKKLKSLPNTDSINKIEDDQNSVFDTDNHSCSDGESKTSKVSSRTGSLRLSEDIRKKTAQKEAVQSGPTQSLTKKPKTQISTLNKKSESIKNNNKENSIPKNLALAKIYKSHEGMTAVSSNTSVMSEVSNISKTSLPTAKNLRTVSSKLANKTNSNRQNSFTIKSDAKSISNRLNSPSTKQLQSVSSSISRNQANFTQNSQDLRKFSIQNDAKSNLTKKNNTEGKKDTLLINANLNHVRAESTMSSPASSVGSSRSKIESKHTKEVKRLEALCEERTKEFTLLKIKHKELLTSFEAVSVAYNYLANDMNGFEVTKLRDKLKLDKIKYEDQIKNLDENMENKQNQINRLRTELDQINKESLEIKTNYEKKISNIEEEYKTQIKILNFDHGLGIQNLKQESDAKISRLNKSIDTMKIENEKLVYELREEISKKTRENLDLDAKIKECEDALSKDKDERISRLLDIQHTLEKEIESLKAALEIKNLDLFELRTQNNKLVTQCDNYNEMNMKYRRYKQEVEELKAILQSKQEAERRASEHNRLLSLRIEKKDKENQRLSMQNEELQFRLQSQPNLSQLNNDNSESDQSTDKSYENIANIKLTRSSTISYHPNNNTIETERDIIQSSLTSIQYENQMNNSGVKLRSKSFKANSNRNNKMYSSYHSAQFRPVSENFDFSINERDVYMTRSAVMYDSIDTSYINRNNEFVARNSEFTTECVSSNDGCDSTSSSNSHLEKNSETEHFINQITCTESN